MNENDLEKFSEIMWGLADNFSAELNKFVLKMRFRALKRFPIEAIEGAAFQIVQNRKYTKMPTVGEIIDYIEGGPGNLEDIAEVEASKVLRAVKHHGSYASIQFDDPVTSAVIQQGFSGWIQLCQDLIMSGEKWFRKDFVKIYSVYSRQNIKNNGHLAGLVELENSARGFEDQIPDPVLIGDFKEIEHKP